VTVLLAIGATLFGAPQSVPPPPAEHRVDKAHCALLALVAGLDRRDESLRGGVRIVTGRTDVATPYSQDEVYVDPAASGYGALELIDWGLVQKAQQRAIYVVTIGNDKILAGRVVATNEPVYVHRRQSTWLVSFYSDDIVSMHDARDLEMLTEPAEKTPVCGVGGKRD